MNLGIRVDTRIKENLKKYQKQLLRLQELDAKEAPTEKIAMDMLCDVFGYDLEHVFGQYGNNGRSCDAVIKDDTCTGRSHRTGIRCNPSCVAAGFHNGAVADVQAGRAGAGFAGAKQ